MRETLEIARRNMVLNQLRPNKIKDENILKSFEITPKENYLNEILYQNCYIDKNLDVTTKRGYLKNLHLAQLLNSSLISKTDKVLHIGGLTGYFSTIISLLCKELYIIEEDNTLFSLLKDNMTDLNNDNIFLLNHKMLDGYSKASPFDLIIIDCPVYKLNDNLKEQLSSNGGRLVYINKNNDNLSKAYKIIKNEKLFSTQYLFDVMTTYRIEEKEEQFSF